MRERPPFSTDGAPPARPRRRLRALLTLASAAAILFLGLETWWVLMPAAGIRSAPRVVEIPPHKGFLEVARILDREGVIASPVGFVLLTLARGSMRSLKAGEYQIPQGASTVVIVNMLEGGEVLQHAVTFREGATIAELAQQLAAERLVKAEDVLRLAKDNLFLRTLDVPAPSLEGYLFPDTYHLIKGLTAEEILARMVARMRERVSPDILASARGRDLNFHQLLTLASIIEKEAVDPGEMALISAVFWNRLKIEMPLQADPTVQYAVGKERQRLTREDLMVDSPFNTYRRAGLPPTPIASPSLAAVRAAANPAPVAYLYFVSTDNRHHRFSVTLAEHNAAVAKYRVARTR
jgi:UPF0755 protein